MNTLSANAALSKPPHYSGDAFAYSLPGGFAKASSWGDVAAHTTPPASVVPAVSSVDRTLVVTDVACDLPSAWLAQHRVVLLPMKIRFDSRTRSDTGDADATQDFLRRDLRSVGADAQTLPLSVSGMLDCIQERLPEEADFVLTVSLASSRGNAYMNSLTAAQNLMRQHGRLRRQSGIARPFKMWVIDSTTALNGEGVLVAECVRCLNDGMSAPRVVQHLDALRKQVHTISVPRDLSFFHRHTRIDGDAALHWLSYGVNKILVRTPVVHTDANGSHVTAQARSADAAIARALGAATQRVNAGLLAPCICVSYAGDTQDVSRWPEFASLQAACDQQGVVLHLGTMSMTNALSLGAAGLAISFASDAFKI